MKFRDPSAWYHVVVAFDSTNGTQANRVKIYVNGVDQSDTANGGGGFSTANYPSQNATSGFNTTSQHEISTYDGSDYHLDGYLAEVNFIDGTALTAASFGEFKNGIWIPKDTSGLTFGTNGFHLTFKDDVVSEGFNTVTYTGNEATQSISGVGFSPALVWLKGRSTNQEHNLFDVLRSDSDGPRRLYSSLTAAEESTVYSGTTNVSSLDADGFTMGNGTSVNESGETFVGWCWEAGTSFSNDTSATSVGNVDSEGKTNTAKGFSIIKWTYSTSADNLVAHGLDSAPTFIIVKSRSTAYNWDVYHSGLSAATKRLLLNTNGAEQNGFFDTAPTSTVFEYNTSAATNGDNMIAYCWHDVSGYSKFGRFTGNGGSQEITVGFEPALVVIKRRDATSNWHVFDNTRNPANNRSNVSNWDRNAVESTNGTMTFSSTGFNDNGWISGSGQEIIYMAWADTREAAFFKDVSGQGNHFNTVNLDYRDSVPDTPTNNFCTLNPLDNDSMTLSNGNLTGISPANAHNAVGCTFGVTGGKWYWEILTGTGSNMFFGMAKSTFQFISQYTNDAYNFSDIWAIATDGQKFGNGSGESSYGSSFSSGDILQLAFDLDNGKFYAGKNGTYFNSGDPAGGTNAAFTNVPTGESMQPFYGSSTSGISHTFNFGQDSSFAGNKSTANSNADGNGHGSFAYAPPSGYLALCSQNLPDVAIIDGTEHFNTVLYTAASSNGTYNITGNGFQPDFSWVKNRDDVEAHLLFDSVRGNTSMTDKFLLSNSTATEGANTVAGTTVTVNADGMQIVESSIDSGELYFNSRTYVMWNWLAATAFSNDASATSVGTIDSSGRTNTTAGFSIISWTGTGSAGTVAHGLGATPTAIIIKNRDQADKWVVYHQGQNASPATGYVSLNETSAFGSSSSVWNDTAPTSTVFSVGTGGSVNASSEKYIAYCFTDIEGYSKHGSYTGNGNTDGTFVFTGFRPVFVLLKEAGNTRNWVISYDDATYYNGVTQSLFPNITQAEDANARLDFLSDGFKLRTTSTSWNNSSGTFIYIAFADQPFKFSNAR